MMRRVRVWAVILFVFCCTLQSSVFALYGGQQTYGSCAYGNTCDNVSEPDGTPSSGGATPTTNAGPATVVTLPSGLEVSVNLYDGQLIPRSGYTIVVTPLNGRGTSFQSVSFSINNGPTVVAAPNTTGTVNWLWLPRQQPGTHIAIVVTGQDGQKVVEQFTVRLSDQTVVSTGVSNTASLLPSTGVSGSIRHFFRALPKSVVYSFPYILFVLLAADIGLLLTQTSREMVELRATRQRLRRAELVAETKRTFTELASHYLRTPLTLIAGGLEEISDAGPAMNAAVSGLQASVTSLIAGVQTNDNVSGQQPSASLRPYRQVALWLPLGAAGLLVGLFDYLAVHVSSLALGRTAALVQIALFVLLGSLLYAAIRFMQLRQRDVRQLHLVAERADKEMRKQEAFADETYLALRADSQRLAAALTSIPNSQSKVFIVDGAQRLEHILDKLAIANELRGARSNAPSVPLELDRVIARAWATLSQAAAAKRVTLNPPAKAVTMYCQNENLLTLVCRHLLDNAVAYAGAGSDVSVTATLHNNRTAIAFTDHGVGIPADKLSWLLTPFTKGEGAETFNHEGLGVSLYLDKLILAYLGGTISIASKPHTGTTVTISLPNAMTNDAAQAPARGTETFQMPWPNAASTAQAAPMVASDEVNS